MWIPMKLYIDPVNLNYFEALASQTSLRVIQLLSDKDMNIKELAEALDISSSIMTKHVRKLESAGLITTTNVNKDGNRHKVCTLLNLLTELQVPFKNNRTDSGRSFHETSMPVGRFTDIQVTVPPCGLADEQRIIGGLDEPVYMLVPERTNAKMLWIGEGYVEYTFPNYLESNQRLTGISISGEFGSEVPGFNDDWPSTIHVTLNDRHLCSFTTPGDFGSVHGALTPAWWDNNQYGILVVIQIDQHGLTINGERKGSITVNDLAAAGDRWVLRFEVGSPAEKGGGLTIYGEKFGNYPQNLVLRTYYV